MLKSLKKKMKDQAGLTLIELLVVIVILGIIAAVAVPMVMSQRDAAEENTNAQNLAVLQDAVNRYNTITGFWPSATMAELVDDYIEEIPACAEGGSGSFTFNTTSNNVNTTCAMP